MVQQQQQDVFFRAEREQLGPQRWLGRQLEAIAYRLRQRLGQPVFGDWCDGQLKTCRLGAEDQLIRCAFGLREQGAQAFMSDDDIAQGRLQGINVQHPGQAQRHRHVVGGCAAFHLIEEPQPLLRVGQGQHRRTVLGVQGQSCRFRHAHRFRQTGHGGGLEQAAQGQFDAEAGTDAPDQLGCQQRMAAEFKEILVNADLCSAQHVGEHIAQHLLLRRPRLAAGRA